MLSSWLFGVPAWVALRVLWRVRVVGKHHLRGLRPPFLMVSNHQSMIDSHVACLAFGLIPRGLFDARIVPFHTPEGRNFMAGRLTRLLHLGLRCVPFTRGAGLHQPAMATVIDLLRRRNVVYMFPEGTRTRDPAGAIRERATPGVGRVLLEARCDVLPVHLSGMNETLPIGARLPRPGKTITITVGDQVPFSEFEDLPNDRKGWQAAAEALLDRIRALAPQDLQVER